jgi:hypothetical protein
VAGHLLHELEAAAVGLDPHAAHVGAANSSAVQCSKHSSTVNAGAGVAHAVQCSAVNAGVMRDTASTAVNANVMRDTASTAVNAGVICMVQYATRT